MSYHITVVAKSIINNLLIWVNGPYLPSTIYIYIYLWSWFNHKNASFIRLCWFYVAINSKTIIQNPTIIRVELWPCCLYICVCVDICLHILHVTTDSLFGDLQGRSHLHAEGGPRPPNFSQVGFLGLFSTFPKLFLGLFESEKDFGPPQNFSLSLFFWAYMPLPKIFLG